MDNLPTTRSHNKSSKAVSETEGNASEQTQTITNLIYVHVYIYTSWVT